jgi:hypothetical protein
MLRHTFDSFSNEKAMSIYTIDRKDFPFQGFYLCDISAYRLLTVVSGGSRLPSLQIGDVSTLATLQSYVYIRRGLWLSRLR